LGYSPARDVKVAVVAVPCSADGVQRSNELSRAQKAKLRSVKVVHEPVIPRNPVPRAGVPARPELPQLTTTELNTPTDTVDDLDTPSVTPSDSVDTNVDDLDTPSTPTLMT